MINQNVVNSFSWGKKGKYWGVFLLRPTIHSHDHNNKYRDHWSLKTSERFSLYSILNRVENRCESWRSRSELSRSPPQSRPIDRSVADPIGTRRTDQWESHFTPPTSCELSEEEREWHLAEEQAHCTANRPSRLSLEQDENQCNLSERFSSWPGARPHWAHWLNGVRVFMLVLLVSHSNTRWGQKVKLWQRLAPTMTINSTWLQMDPKHSQASYETINDVMFHHISNKKNYQNKINVNINPIISFYPSVELLTGTFFPQAATMNQPIKSS